MDLMLNILLGLSWLLSLGFVFQMGVAKGFSQAYNQINLSLQKGVDFLECVFIKEKK